MEKSCRQRYEIQEQSAETDSVHEPYHNSNPLNQMKKSWTFETILKKSNFYFILNQSRTREDLKRREQGINIRLGGAPADDKSDNGARFVVRAPCVEEEVFFEFCNFFV